MNLQQFLNVSDKDWQMEISRQNLFDNLVSIRENKNLTIIDVAKELDIPLDEVFQEDMEYIDSDMGPLTHNAIKHFLEKGSEKHYLVIKEFNGELYLDFECDNDHTAPCRRRPVDHANLESWTFEEATESGFPCWIKEWVDSRRFTM